MKKTILTLTAALLFTVLAGGCDAPEVPIPPISQTSAQPETNRNTSPAFAERLAGRYRCEGGESGETNLEIYHLDGTLIAEAEQQYAAYFAAELIPDTPDILNDPEAESACFTVYAFSGFSNFGMYWEETPRITLSETEEGLLLTESDGTAVEFRRDNTLQPLHIPDRYAEYLPPRKEAAYPEGMTGIWTAEYFGGYRIHLLLSEDGRLRWYCKKEGEPISLFIGIGRAETVSGILTVIAERVGYSSMPWQFSLDYEVTGTGLLILKNKDIDGLLPTEDELVLTQNHEKE